MSNFTLKQPYRPLGRGFFARQFSRATGAASRIVRRGLTSDDKGSSPSLPAPGTAGGAPKDKTLMYAGAGVLGLLLLSMFGRRGRA
jgi:hypothetical protein